MLVKYDPFANSMFYEIIDDIMACHCHIYGKELMSALEYDNEDSFKQAINAAMKACTSLSIPIHYHFREIFISSSDGLIREYKLSDIACYFITMNGDPGYPKVANAQYYFLNIVSNRID